MFVMKFDYFYSSYVSFTDLFTFYKKFWPKIKKKTKDPRTPIRANTYRWKADVYFAHLYFPFEDLIPVASIHAKNCHYPYGSYHMEQPETWKRPPQRHMTWRSG